MSAAKKEEKKVLCFKKVSGLICMSIGLGMLLTLLTPGWSYIVAVILSVVGFWNLFM